MSLVPSIGLQHFQVNHRSQSPFPILNHHRLDKIENLHLQRLKIKLMAYNFRVKGKKNDTSDALLRNPIIDPSPDDSLAVLDTLGQPDLSITEIRTLTSTEPLPYCLDDLKKSAQEDTEYKQLQHFILHGFPHHCCSIAIRPVTEMVYHLPKSYLATQYKISCQLPSTVATTSSRCCTAS